MIWGLSLGILDCLEVGFSKEKPSKRIQKGLVNKGREKKESEAWKSSENMHQGREHSQLLSSGKIMTKSGQLGLAPWKSSVTMTMEVLVKWCGQQPNEGDIKENE